MRARDFLKDDSDLPDMGKDTWNSDDWHQEIGVDAGQGYQRASGNLPGGVNLSIAADAPGQLSTFSPQQGVNIAKGPASLYLGDKGAVSGSYNIPLDDKSSVTLNAAGQRDQGIQNMGLNYQRGGFTAGVNKGTHPGATPQFNVGYSTQFEEDVDQGNIEEAFDKPYAFNWSRGDHGDYDILVKLPDGSPLSIAFDHEGDNVWHVAFDRGHSQDITGAGDAQRIFATVLASIQQFIIKQDPDRLYFSASKDVEPGQNPESRARLYERMVNRYAAAMGYDVVVDDRRGHAMFILDKEQGLAEQSTHEDRHPNDTPYGPETKPTMPKGTVRVDVSDVYDWYKLGMHISDLEKADKSIFGKGPPSTIFSFGSEDEEHEYIKQLEKLGLTTTDIDPKDPNQPKGMPRQKVDPTFNVNEEEFNGIDITMDVEGDEIMVTATGNGRELGHVLFVDEGEYLMPQDLEVDERFQGQGIAAAMYDYVKSKGYKIRRSGQQTDAGAGFWNKHRPDQNVWESESSKPTMGINVRSDGDIDYAGLIIDGRKKYESRRTDSLRPYVGKTVAIVRTGKGSAVAIGQVTVGEPVVVDAEKFDKMRDQHLVPQGSKFDIDPGATKYLYPMIDPVRWDSEKLVKQKGIVARKIDDLDENFADGKVKGKSRPGRVKRAGASCNGSVTDLRARAKKASGELAKMYHWCANMKSGRNK